MRKAFIEELITQARIDSSLFLVVGDLGYSVVEPFVQEFPDRFLNAGVAEQNMTGVAAGLASEGYHVLTYSIANFPTLRCIEQIRNDICYHKLAVTIVTVGGGLAYGSQGYSHHGREDLAMMRVLPGMTVVAPGDPVETTLALRELLKIKDGPSYLRLGKTREPIVHEQELHFQLGQAIQVLDGSDITLISTGGALEKTVQAGKELASQGIQAAVLSMHTVSPLDVEAVKKTAQASGRILTVEEHGEGGLAAAVAETLAGMSTPVHFVPLYLDAQKIHVGGDQEYLCALQGISIENIVQTAQAMCE